MLYRLSPTHAGAVDKKAIYAFGSKPDVVVAEDDFFAAERAKITGSEVQAYRDGFTQNVVTDVPVRDLGKSWAIDYGVNGNAYALLTISVVNGQTVGHIKRLDRTSCLYYLPDGDENQAGKYIGVSPVWTTDYVRKYPPKIYGVYPLFTDGEEGTVQTIFHLKTPGGGLYGRPESESSDMMKYSEVQAALYRIRAAHGNFAGRLIIETEEDNPAQRYALENESAQADGYSSFVDRFEKNYTEKSDEPQHVMVTMRPFGSRPMFVFAMPPNTSHDYYKAIKDIDKSDIYQSHSVTLRFMAEDVAGGFSSDVYIQDYVINMEPVINDLRMVVTGFMDKIINAIFTYAGRENLTGYGLYFRSPVYMFSDKFKMEMLTEKTENAPANDL